MPYKIVYTDKAAKELAKIAKGNRNAANLIAAAIAALAVNPHPSHSKRLQGRVEYRIRVGDYRIVYLVDDEKITVTITRIAHRSTVYK